MKRRCLALLIAVVMLFAGCAPVEASGPKQYTATFLSLFDTLTTVVGYADSPEAFETVAHAIRDDLQEYHQLFDIYHEYDGINNLKTVNDAAGVAPVQVDERIIRLLQDCKAIYDITGGKVNAAMGSVLNLWHEARSDGRDDPLNAYLPDADALIEAAAHMDFDKVEIDPEAGTVYITDPAMRLDVGAIAKGWAAQRAAEAAPAGLLISVGGNVCATGPKEGGAPWVIGIQNPADPEQYLHTIYLSSGSVVTSGDYQRTYWVDGKSYHHIVDPDTLYPATYWRSVTIVCPDSGLADALSTALFLLPQDAGQALLAQYDAEALWAAADGSLYYSPGFYKIIRT